MKNKVLGLILILISHALNKRLSTFGMLSVFGAISVVVGI